MFLLPRLGSQTPSRLIPLIIATALFMENMDATVLSTSLPAIARDLMQDPIALKLALTSYLVSLAVFIPISGWMADSLGARTVFRAAIAVFMAGSVLCALSSTLGGFVAARFVQGMGGAMMVPVGRLVILRSTAKADLVQALSYLTIPALVGPVIGPPLGGFITTYWHWRWIFLINLPIGVLGMILATRYIENLREDQVPPLDRGGFVLTSIGLTGLMLGLASAGHHLVAARVSQYAILVGILLLLAYVWHARHTRYPLLDLRLFGIGTFNAGVVGGFMFRIGIGAIPFLLPLMLQLGFGLTPFQSGLLTCATAIGAIFMKTIAARILRRYGFRLVLVVNSGLTTLSLALFGLFHASTSHLLMIAVFVFGGCLRSLQFTSLNAITYADIDQPEMSQATSLASVMQQLAAGMGVTVGAFALQGARTFARHGPILPVDFSWAFLVVALIAASSVFWFVRLPSNSGAELAARPAM